MTTLAALHQEIQVSFRYGVYFTQGVLAPENPLLAEIVAGGGKAPGRQVLVVVDRGLYRHHPRLLAEIAAYAGHYPDRLQLPCPPLLLPGGEQVKNEAAPVSRVQQAIHEAGLCRHALVIAVGGGALIDMAGYAAATAHRGIGLIRIPTTVMAQAMLPSGSKTALTPSAKKTSSALLRRPGR